MTNNRIMSVHYRVDGLKNIGDYIQAIAAKQFMKSEDFVDRDELKVYKGLPCRLIMNGWFMHRPDMFPPSNSIDPLVTSFHITPFRADEILTAEGLGWLRKHQPIGCRDKATERLLKAKGIDAYFSGCLTLTLGRTYRHRKTQKKVLFVDPQIPHKGKLSRMLFNAKVANDLMTHLPSVVAVARKFRKAGYVGGRGVKKLLKSMIYAAAFLSEYSNVFNRRTLVDSDYTIQEIPWKDIDLAAEGGSVDSTLMKIADERLRDYETRPLVVTSRIHCALPCTAIGTPVIFLNDVVGRYNARHQDSCNGRYEGLLDFFNVMEFSKDWRLSATFDTNGKVCENTVLPEKSNWKEYALELAQCCERFAENGCAAIK